MSQLKITAWNVEHMGRLFKGDVSAETQRKREARKAAIGKQIAEMAPDVLCVLEGPPDPVHLHTFCSDTLGGDYVLVEANDGKYGQRGTQYIWFLVRSNLAGRAELLPIDVYDELAGKTWPVHYWGQFTSETHRHYRHPQALRLQWHGTLIECVGLHLKSKFVRNGKSDWEAGGERKQVFIREAIKARIKLATEAQNVRNFIDKRFEQSRSPAVVVLGDLNDGPGKELFEDQYLFFDLVGNIQGDVFFARRFLNHCLFDQPDSLRWSVAFSDFVDPDRNPQILLDHILFTQPMVDGTLPIIINGNAGKVEHEVHDRINAQNPRYAATSDHKPISVVISPNGPSAQPIAFPEFFSVASGASVAAAESVSSVKRQVVEIVEVATGRESIGSLESPLRQLTQYSGISAEVRHRIRQRWPQIAVADVAEIKNSSSTREIFKIVLKALGLEEE